MNSRTSFFFKYMYANRAKGLFNRVTFIFPGNFFFLGGERDSRFRERHSALRISGQLKIRIESGKRKSVLTSTAEKSIPRLYVSGREYERTCTRAIGAWYWHRGHSFNLNIKHRRHICRFSVLDRERARRYKFGSAHSTLLLLSPGRVSMILPLVETTTRIALTGQCTAFISFMADFRRSLCRA